ncbi:MAG: prepilin peptidase [Elusimicrobiota bacterium]
MELFNGGLLDVLKEAPVFFTIIYLLAVFIFGCLIGSFTNVCMYRIPLDQSICHPRSHCTSCNTLISWYDNVPIFSYIVLGRKCRHCGSPISWRYPFVEFLTGTAFFLIAYYYSLQMIVPFFLYYSFVMICISGIDISSQIIPDVFSLSLIAVGIGSSIFNPLLGNGPGERIFNSLLGMGAGGGILLLLGILGTWMFKKDAMGGGDLKLLAGIGAFIGWHKVFSTLFIASVLGTIIGVYLILSKKIERRGYIPFGPFLALAGYINLFIPDPLIILSQLWF